MILALLVFKLQLTPHRMVAILDFANMATPWGARQKIQTVWHGRPLGHIWCFWENLNQNIPNTPDYYGWFLTLVLFHKEQGHMIYSLDYHNYM